MDYGLVHVDDRKDGRTMDGRREIPTGDEPEIGIIYLGQNPEPSLRVYLPNPRWD